jgi:hypothetical protein
VKREAKNKADWYMPLMMLGIMAVDIACWAGIIAGGIALWNFIAG